MLLGTEPMTRVYPCLLAPLTEALYSYPLYVETTRSCFVSWREHYFQIKRCLQRSISNKHPLLPCCTLRYVLPKHFMRKQSRKMKKWQNDRFQIRICVGAKDSVWKTKLMKRTYLVHEIMRRVVPLIYIYYTPCCTSNNTARQRSEAYISTPERKTSRKCNGCKQHRLRQYRMMQYVASVPIGWDI